MTKGNYFLLLVLFITGFIQAQDPEVVLTISPTSADVGEIIKITVKSNVQGKVEIDNLPSSFVHGYDVMNGMEQVIARSLLMREAPGRIMVILHHLLLEVCLVPTIGAELRCIRLILY